MEEKAGFDYIGLTDVISHPSDMSPPIARVGSTVLVKCGENYETASIVEIKSPEGAVVVFRDDLTNQKQEVRRERMTLSRGN